jgi:hypothetical protein
MAPFGKRAAQGAGDRKPEIHRINSTLILPPNVLGPPHCPHEAPFRAARHTKARG